MTLMWGAVCIGFMVWMIAHFFTGWGMWAIIGALALWAGLKELYEMHKWAIARLRAQDSDSRKAEPVQSRPR